jgi:hypothetical protein
MRLSVRVSLVLYYLFWLFFLLFVGLPLGAAAAVAIPLAPAVDLLLRWVFRGIDTARRPVARPGRDRRDGAGS